MSPIVSGILEIVDAPLYDTVALPHPSPDADLPPVHLFEHPIGIQARAIDGSWRVKSEIETNMFLPGSLPPPCKFLLRSIRVALLDEQGGLKGISSIFYRAAVLEFCINGKRYWRGPLYLVADPAVLWCEGPAPFAELTTSEREALIRSMRHTFDADSRPLIEVQQHFECRVTFDPSAPWGDRGRFAPAGLVVVLEGNEARAIV